MRHLRKHYMVVGEGLLSQDETGRPVCYRAPSNVELREFRFSRLGPKGKPVSPELCTKLAEAMTTPGNQPEANDPIIPAGFTYLGQFVDHDLTFDKTQLAFASPVTVEELVQARSPSLDLDCLYGRGPQNSEDSQYYSDGIRLKMGRTAASPPDGGTNVEREGFDLPRSGQGPTLADQRAALIPDPRNDENLAVAQTHLAFIRFHNRMVDKLAAQGTPSHDLFERAREQVTKHYQWMLWTDYLSRIASPGVIEEVWTKGRKFFEVPHKGTGPLTSYMQVTAADAPTMPIEFSVAAFRLGHSMIRGRYEWNRVFHSGPGALTPATLDLLFRFSSTSGNLSPGGDVDDPQAGDTRLPTNWIADFRRLYNFEMETGRADLALPDRENQFNMAKRIDTLLVEPLRTLPKGSIGERANAALEAGLRNLAFRNLMRGNMVSLASGQQMAEVLGVTPLTPGKILEGAGGADTSKLSDAEKKELTESTPLWFYILREAELNNGRLGHVGSRIVVETFHRAMEGSRYSIIRDPTWRPSFGPDANTFRMTDLLLFAFEGKKELLSPLGDVAP